MAPLQVSPPGAHQDGSIRKQLQIYGTASQPSAAPHAAAVLFNM